jgi:uncharacterized SAM-binding protein YcdF (DUF218 family)
MSAPASLIVLFGAAVRADGRPSLALARRIASAREAALREPDATVLCSGAAGKVGPSEASVMAARLEAGGVGRDRLILDEASRDTLQSVLVARRLMRSGRYGRCLVCSDRYHLPRIRLLLAALGIGTEPVPVAPGHGRAPWRDLAFMRLRELAATPYDLALVLARRARLTGGEGA